MNNWNLQDLYVRDRNVHESVARRKDDLYAQDLDVRDLNVQDLNVQELDALQAGLAKEPLSEGASIVKQSETKDEMITKLYNLLLSSSHKVNLLAGSDPTTIYILGTIIPTDENRMFFINLEEACCEECVKAGHCNYGYDGVCSRAWFVRNWYRFFDGSWHYPRGRRIWYDPEIICPKSHKSEVCHPTIPWHILFQGLSSSRLRASGQKDVNQSSQGLLLTKILQFKSIATKLTPELMKQINRITVTTSDEHPADEAVFCSALQNIRRFLPCLVDITIDYRYTLDYDHSKYRDVEPVTGNVTGQPNIGPEPGQGTLPDPEAVIQRNSIDRMEEATERARSSRESVRTNRTMGVDGGVSTTQSQRSSVDFSTHSVSRRGSIPESTGRGNGQVDGPIDMHRRGRSSEGISTHDFAIPESPKRRSTPSMWERTRIRFARGTKKGSKEEKSEKGQKKEKGQNEKTPGKAAPKDKTKLVPPFSWIMSLLIVIWSWLHWKWGRIWGKTGEKVIGWREKQKKQRKVKNMIWRLEAHLPAGSSRIKHHGDGLWETFQIDVWRDGGRCWHTGIAATEVERYD